MANDVSTQDKCSPSALGEAEEEKYLRLILNPEFVETLSVLKQRSGSTKNGSSSSDQEAVVQKTKAVPDLIESEVAGEINQGYGVGETEEDHKHEVRQAIEKTERSLKRLHSQMLKGKYTHSDTRFLGMALIDFILFQNNFKI
jgi:hypothetical protein